MSSDSAEAASKEIRRKPATWGLLSSGPLGLKIFAALVALVVFSFTVSYHTIKVSSNSMSVMDSRKQHESFNPQSIKAESTEGRTSSKMLNSNNRTSHHRQERRDKEGGSAGRSSPAENNDKKTTPNSPHQHKDMETKDKESKVDLNLPEKSNKEKEKSQLVADNNLRHEHKGANEKTKDRAKDEEEKKHKTHTSQNKNIDGPPEIEKHEIESHNNHTLTTHHRHESKQGRDETADGRASHENTDTTKNEQPNSNHDTKEEKERLNILLLYADDWRYDTLGAAGNPILKTPHLDQLAKHGMLFTHNCVTTSICWISRATLYTGQYYSRHKSKLIDEPVFLEHWNESYHGLLQQHGYYTGFVGKWHHANFPEKTFNYSRLYYGAHWEWDFENDAPIHVTVKNERDSMKFLRERPQDGTPFALAVSFFATHAEDGNPLQFLPQNESMSLYVNDTIPVAPSATQESWERLPYFFTDGNEGRTRWKWRFDTPEKYQSMMKNYYRMATEVDTACGNLVAELERQGVLNNTLVIFTTDNGYYHAEHGLADKWYAHQESIRVPLVIYDPRMDKELVGTKSDDFTLSIDLAPTILSAAGIAPPPRMQGRDMSFLYRKKNKASSIASDSLGSVSSKTNIARRQQEMEWRKEFFYEHPDIFDNPEWICPSEALVRKEFKYILWPAFGVEQLFDLVNDPYEEKDLINETAHAERVKEMRSRFKELKAAAK